MTDTTLRVNGREYNVIAYLAEDTGYWRAEAAYLGRVIEVVDVASERAALDGIRSKLEKRRGAKGA